MADKGNIPEPMSFSGNVSENWKLFIQKVHFYIGALGLSGASDARKISILMNCMGDEGIHVYNSFTWSTDGDEKKFDKVVEAFEKHCTPKKNLTFERYIFNQITQRENETSESFVSRLNNQAKKCEYSSLEKPLIMDRIVIGCIDSKLREKLLLDADLTYDKAVTAIKAAEAVRSQQNSLRDTLNEPVHKINKNYNKNNDTNVDDNITNCLYCGWAHKRRECPAFHHDCQKCKKRGHYETKCEDLEKRKNQSPKVQEVGCVDISEDVLDIEDLIIQTIDGIGEKLFATLIVKGSGFQFQAQVDSGTVPSCLPVRYYSKMFPHRMIGGKPDGINLTPQPQTRIRRYGGSQITHYGALEIECSVDGETFYTMKWYVIDDDGPAVLGWKDCQKFNLLRINPALSKYINNQRGHEDVIFGSECQPESHGTIVSSHSGEKPRVQSEFSATKAESHGNVVPLRTVEKPHVQPDSSVDKVFSHTGEKPRVQTYRGKAPRSDSTESHVTTFPCIRKASPGTIVCLHKREKSHVQTEVHNDRVHDPGGTK